METKFLSVLIPLGKPGNPDALCSLVLSLLCAFGAEMRGYLF